MTRALAGVRVGAVVLLTLAAASAASAEVLVRWDRDTIPSPASLGIESVVIPAGNRTLVRRALDLGYRVFLEAEAASLETVAPPPGNVAGVFVSGKATAARLNALKKRLAARGTIVAALDDRASWPHIRSNWVTRNKNDVLQVTGRSAQPWIENNAALLRIIRAAGPASEPRITYAWKPITLSEIDDGPLLENYLVAIAEAGSFGAHLLLPLHPRFQAQLALGLPHARADWEAIRRSIAFHSWSLPARYDPVANIGVIAREPMLNYEILNLLARHNLPFTMIDPAAAKQPQAGLDVLLALEDTTPADAAAVSRFAEDGGTAVLLRPTGELPWRSAAAETKTELRATFRHGKGRIIEVLAPVSDPDAFALEIRQALGPERRLLDIWNGITVLTAMFREPAADEAGESQAGTGAGGTVLLTLVNYAAQPLPVQLRVKGTFSQVHYESPDEPPVLLPFEHRNGFTELVLPALRVGARIFLTPSPDTK